MVSIVQFSFYPVRNKGQAKLPFVPFSHLLGKVHLPFGGHESFASRVRGTAYIVDHFLDLEDTLRNEALICHVGGIQITLIAQPGHQTVATNVDVVVGEALSELAEVHAVDRSTYGAMELDTLLLYADDLVLILDSLQRCNKQGFGFGIRVREPLVNENNRVVDVTAGLTDGGKQFIKDPVLELLSLRLVGAADESVYISLRDEFDNARNPSHFYAPGFNTALAAVDVELAGYVCVPQRLANINGAEEKLIAFADNAKFTKHLRKKNLRNSGHNNTLHFFLSGVTNRYLTSAF